MIRDRACCVSSGWQGPTTREASSCQTSSPSRRSTPTGPFRRPPRRPARRAPTSSSAAGSPVPASWPGRAFTPPRRRSRPTSVRRRTTSRSPTTRSRSSTSRLSSTSRRRVRRVTQPELRPSRHGGRARGDARQDAQGLLGSKAVKKPKFDFGDTVTNQDKFKLTAQVLEDTGVAAYAGQGPNLLQRPLVVAALSIHSVEARHAAWIRFLNSSGGVAAAAVRRRCPAPRRSTRR